MHMKITDELYGQADIEPVLAQLIETKTLQRLKGIHQAGAAYLVNREWNVTRYEHSVGVMLLIKQLGGTLEEQIAGLLHDVSHTLGPVEVEENEAEYDFQMVGKMRIIDVPVSLDGKTIQPVSDLSIKIQAMNERALAKSLKGTFVKIKGSAVNV